MVWLESLDHAEDIRGISVTLIDASGQVLYGISIPKEVNREELTNMLRENQWLIVPEGVVNVIPSIETLPNLTLKDLLTLSAKGYDLTWSDFSGYSHTDVGSGLYIWHLPIKYENLKSPLLLSEEHILVLHRNSDSHFAGSVH